jgi:hypothetical protein
MQQEQLELFNGADYEPCRDSARLSAQHNRIKNLMLDGQARTLGQIAEVTGDPEASISAQLRHMRKERFGAYTVSKNHLGNGLYTYKVTK